MKFKNGLVTEVERGVPGLPQINHTLMQKACDRFLAKRGLYNPGFRRSEWLFGRMAIGQQRRAAA
ncbi:MAG: hypothetical protein EBR82_38575 [Caulobacteraceae bacterium]|nr:hypothetical protein [Caulobacteraceae bacterium]